MDDPGCWQGVTIHHRLELLPIDVAFPRTPHRWILCRQLGYPLSCFVDTISGFRAPSVFLKSDSVLRCSASLGWVRLNGVPRRHQYYQSTTTSCIEYGVAYLFASPLQPILSEFAPIRRRGPLGLVPIKPGTAG